MGKAVFGLVVMTLMSVSAYGLAPLPQDTNLGHYIAVSFVTADQVTIEGHLAVPKNAKAPYPAVLFLVGSGAGNRYENIPANVAADGQPALLFKPIETELLKRGIAVMTYDKRGVHPKDDAFLTSDVDLNVFHTATANHLASDAVQAFDVLKAQTLVDASRLGVLGHSEGTILGLKVAEQRPGEVRSLFMLGLLSRAFLDIFSYQAITNPMRLFYALDDNQDGQLETSEVAKALAADPGMAETLPAWDDLRKLADKTGDGKVSEQEWRYFLEEQARQSLDLIMDNSKPWPAKGLPREWMQQYFAEGPYLERRLKFCGITHVFQGEIDIQTPFEDALQLNDTCQTRGTPLASFQSYANEGHAFSPRIGYKKIRDTIGPIDPVVPVDIANEAAKSLL